MRRKSIMLVAGEPSGDLLAAELVSALRPRVVDREAVPSEDHQPLQASFAPEFFGAGGPQMAAAGVELVENMTEHAVVGLWEVLRKYRDFRRLFRRLLDLAKLREPDAIICVDFSGFNLRFGGAVRRYVRSLNGTFANWSPCLVQYVSPQVWASRPERARRLARNFDLLISILPFEKEWYEARVPGFSLEFVGHPLVDRMGAWTPAERVSVCRPASDRSGIAPWVVVLPGSRVGELERHLPVMLETIERLKQAYPGLEGRMILPNQALAERAKAFAVPAWLPIQVGNLAECLSGADLAIASTGTVMLECAWFGVPTVALYKTSWSTYQIGKRLIQVPFLAMPNLMAGEELYPEFIQKAATAENLVKAAQTLLEDKGRRQHIKTRLRKIVADLGPPGASARAAEVILDLLYGRPATLRAYLGS